MPILGSFGAGSKGGFGRGGKNLLEVDYLVVAGGGGGGRDDGGGGRRVHGARVAAGAARGPRRGGHGVGARRVRGRGAAVGRQLDPGRPGAPRRQRHDPRAPGERRGAWQHRGRGHLERATHLFQPSVTQMYQLLTQRARTAVR